MYYVFPSGIDMGNKINVAGSVVTMIIQYASPAIFYYIVCAYLFGFSRLTSLILVSMLFLFQLGWRLYVIRKLKRRGAAALR